MATITSNETGGGNWSDPSSWSGGAVPGVSDDAQILSGDTITVDVNQTSASFVNLIVDAGGTLVYATGGTYALYHSGTATINGTFTMDASGASSQLSWTAGGARTYGSTAVITIRGRTKDVAAQFTDAPDGTYVYVDNGAGGDVDGWEVGDYLAAVYSTTSDRQPITADGGFSGGRHTYTCALSSSLPDEGRVINLTRSAVLVSETATPDSVADGASLTCEYVEHVNVRWSVKQRTAWATPIFTGCSWRQDALSNSCGIDLYAGATISDICAYLIGSNTYRVNNFVFCRDTDWSELYATRWYVLFSARDASSYAQVVKGNIDLWRVYLSQCEVGNGTLLTADRGGRSMVSATISDCVIWGTTTDNRLSGLYLWGPCFLRNVVIGADVGGNAGVIPIGMTCYGSCTVYADNCLFSATTPIKVETTVAPEHARIVSTNHGQVSGARFEPQLYGTATKTADTDFDEDVCDEIDPSRTTHPFIYRVVFECPADQVGNSPTLTFNHILETADENVGDVTIELGDWRCGLTGIASGDTLTQSNTLAQHTVTFSGTTTLAGEIEVLIKVLDHADRGQLRVGDFAVSWA